MPHSWDDEALHNEKISVFNQGADFLSAIKSWSLPHALKRVNILLSCQESC
jgi:hypothetical protein